VLEALIRAGGGRFSGVRYSVGYDADPTIGNSRPDSAPHMYVRPEIRAGVARLAAHGLVLDAWCYHPQLADVIALARAVPQVTIVMCHVGGVLGYGAYAGKKEEVHATWRASMAELARCPNVSVKLGGMLNRGAALNFRTLSEPPNSEAWAAAWRPYVEPCIELFGAERCNFESNFPVDRMGTGYAHLQAIRTTGLRLDTPAGEIAIQPARATDDPAQGGRSRCGPPRRQSLASEGSSRGVEADDRAGDDNRAVAKRRRGTVATRGTAGRRACAGRLVRDVQLGDRTRSHPQHRRQPFHQIRRAGQSP
jgi:predicted TIM-barrel fold metal-dependent hydrolase